MERELPLESEILLEHGAEHPFEVEVEPSSDARVADEAMSTGARVSKWKQILRSSTSIKLPLLGAFVYTFVSVAKSVAFFPYLRTTISCNSTIEPVEDTSDANWSGSDFCTDLELVARQAQLLKGISEGLDQLSHCLMLPLLGHAIDCFGRRWGILVGMWGIFLQYMFYAFASIYVDWSYSLIIIGSIIQGATGIFMTAINASIHDIQVASNDNESEETHASHAYAMIQVVQGNANSIAVVMTALLIVAQNLSDYAEVWTFFSTLSLLVFIWCFYAYSETITERQPWQWSKASPTNVFVLFRENETIRWIGLGSFFGVLSTTALSVLQAFTIHEYKWTQTYSTLVFLALSPFSLVSIVASFSVIPRYGPVYVIGCGLYLMNASMICFSLANFSSFFVYAGIACLLSCVGAFPAFMQTITSVCGDGNRTGEILASISAVCLGAIAFGNLVYASLFALHVLSTLPFIVGLPFMWVSTYCAKRAREHVYDSVQPA